MYHMNTFDSLLNIFHLIYQSIINSDRLCVPTHTKRVLYSSDSQPNSLFVEAMYQLNRLYSPKGGWEQCDNPDHDHVTPAHNNAIIYIIINIILSVVIVTKQLLLSICLCQSYYLIILSINQLYPSSSHQMKLFTTSST